MRNCAPPRRRRRQRGDDEKLQIQEAQNRKGKQTTTKATQIAHACASAVLCARVYLTECACLRILATSYTYQQARRRTMYITRHRGDARHRRRARTRKENRGWIGFHANKVQRKQVLERQAHSLNTKRASGKKNELTAVSSEVPGSRRLDRAEERENGAKERMAALPHLHVKFDVRAEEDSRALSLRSGSREKE